MDRGKRIIGILLIVLSVAALFTWERWGKTRFLYDDVLVCRENVSKGDIISENMLETVKMDINIQGWIDPKDKQKVIGKEAASFIHKGVPLFHEYFESPDLTAAGSKGKFVLTVPSDWLSCLPASISRGDSAYFFRGSRYLTQTPVRAVDNERGSLEVIVTEKQAGQLAGAAASGEKLVIVYS